MPKVIASSSGSAADPVMAVDGKDEIDPRSVLIDQVEQAPDPESRVTLGEGRDRSDQFKASFRE